jgi:transcriptional regulator with XRE-family HTH domain
MNSRLAHLLTIGQPKKLAVLQFLMYGAVVMFAFMNFHSDKIRPRHFLYQWRVRARMTQQQLADAINASKGDVSRYESGKRPMTLEKAYQFGAALGIDGLAVFRDPEEPSADELLKNATADQRKQVFAVIDALLKTGTDSRR